MRNISLFSILGSFILIVIGSMVKINSQGESGNGLLIIGLLVSTIGFILLVLSMKSRKQQQD